MEKSAGRRGAAAPPEPTAVLRGHEAAVNAVALCVPAKDGSGGTSGQPPLLASGDAGGAVCLWSLRTKRRLQVEPAAHSLAAPASGGGRKASGTDSGNGEGGVQQVAFVDGGRQLLTQGRGHGSCVKLWATERLGTSGSCASAVFPVASLAFCKFSLLELAGTSSTEEGSTEAQSSCLFAVYGEEEGRRGEGETVALWDLRERQPALRFPSPVEGHDSRSKTGMCMCLRLFAGASAGGSPCLASLWENGHLYLWDSRKPSSPFAATTTDGATETKRMHDEPPLAFDLAVVNGGRDVRGVSGGADAHIGIFRAGLKLDEIVVGEEGAAEPVIQGRSERTTPGLVKVEQRLEVGHAGVGAVAIRPDQKIFATGGWDKRVRVWDFKRARPLAILKAHAGAVNCLAFSNTNNLLVSGSADTRIACWALY